MIAQPYWITTQLAIVPRPRGGDWLDDEMLALREAGIDVVVSMLEKEEELDLGLEREGLSAERANLRFVNFAVPDRGIPLDKYQFEKFLENLEHQLASGRRVGIHCRVCIGRASITSACLLIRSGVTSECAWQQISASRGCSVPDTTEQRQWVDRYMRPNS